MKSAFYRWLPLFLLVMGGLLLRLNDLGGESLWPDEGGSVRGARMSVSEMIDATAKDVHPPFYYLMLHYWVALFGASEASVRLPSAILGAATLLLIYKLGLMLWNREAALTATLLAALSDFMVEYSQEARQYSLIAFLAAASMYFFLSLYRRRNIIDGLGLAAINSIMIYTHVYGFFIIAAQNLHFLATLLFSRDRRRPGLLGWIVLQAAPGLIFIPWWLVLFRQIKKVGSGFWLNPPKPSELHETFVACAGHALMLWLFLAVALAAAASLRKKEGSIQGRDLCNSLEGLAWTARPRDTDKIFFLLAWTLVPVVIPFVFSLLAMPMYKVRYTIIVTPAFYLLTARGIERIGSVRIKALIVAAAVAVYGWNLSHYYLDVDKEQWREATALLEYKAAPGELVLFFSNFSYINVYAYYSTRTDLREVGIPWNELKDDKLYRKRVVAEIKGRSPFWIVRRKVSRVRQVEPRRFQRFGYRLVEKHDFHGVEIFKFEKKRPRRRE